MTSYPNFYTLFLTPSTKSDAFFCEKSINRHYFLLGIEAKNAASSSQGKPGKEKPEKVRYVVLNALFKLDIGFLDPFNDYPHVLSLARSFNRSVYDGAYLSLAMQKKPILSQGTSGSTMP